MPRQIVVCFLLSLSLFLAGCGFKPDATATGGHRIDGYARVAVLEADGYNRTLLRSHFPPYTGSKKSLSQEDRKRLDEAWLYNWSGDWPERVGEYMEKALEDEEVFASILSEQLKAAGVEVFEQSRMATSERGRPYLTQEQLGEIDFILVPNRLRLDSKSTALFNSQLILLPLLAMSTLFFLPADCPDYSVQLSFSLYETGNLEVPLDEFSTQATGGKCHSLIWASPPKSTDKKGLIQAYEYLLDQEIQHLRDLYIL